MDKTVIEIIANIYSAAVSPEEWPQVAQQVQELIGGHSVCLALSDSEHSRVNCLFTNGVSDDDAAFYQTNIASHDPLTAAIAEQPAGSLLMLRDRFTEAELQAMPEYHDFYDRVGMNDFAGSYFYQNQSTHGWCVVARSKQDQAFTTEQRELLNILTPHLSRAAHISQLLSSAQQSTKIAQDTLETLPVGIALLSKQCEVVGHNSRINRFLSKPKHSFKPLLELPCTIAQEQLTQALALSQADTPNPPSQCIYFEFKQRQITVVVAAWLTPSSPLPWVPQDTCAIVLINDPADANPIPVEWLRERYNLSKAEARVLMQVLAGKAAAEIADSLFVTTHTVRFHIKNLLLKVECSSQTQMVTTILKAFSGLY